MQTFSADTPSKAVVLAWARLVRAQQQVLGAVEADLKTAGFPPLAWYDVLLELRRADGARLRPVEIEARLLIAQHNVSRLIDRLEKAGHVKREHCEVDGRGQLVALTDAGGALLKAMWPAYRAAIQMHVGEKLSEAEAQSLSKTLAQLLKVRG